MVIIVTYLHLGLANTGFPYFILYILNFTAIVVEEPECGGKCSKNAVCRGDKCVCKRGFRGDGINCDSKSISNTVCNINEESFPPTCIEDLMNFYPI